AGFYRRVSYRPGSDPYLYEFVTVAVRLPSPTHRFAEQAPVRGVAGGGAAATASDFVAPVPWLVMFDSIPALRPAADYAEQRIAPPTGDPDRRYRWERWLLNTYTPPATLRFVASSSLGPLLPPGSVFIPAVNDYLPTQIQDPNNPQAPWDIAGFVPTAPDTLPVYEVVDRVYNANSGTYDIIVRNNGYYPWVRTPPGGINNGQIGLPFASLWPVWIIPPAYETRGTNPGVPQPLYPDESQILSVNRRYVRLRELP
ncbi:MAG: hypothetical protein AB1716_09035, partial [Planctomycetota bacterium]